MLIDNSNKFQEGCSHSNLHEHSLEFKVRCKYLMCMNWCILGNPGVIHYVTLHSSPLGQLTEETSFSMNIHNTGEYPNNQNVANTALLSSAEDSFVLLPLLSQENPINVFVSN